MEQRNIQTFEEEWQGITLTIRYEPDWLGGLSAHLQVESAGRVALPITETGYRSHFCSPVSIEEEGGPVAYVMAWIKAEAETAVWIEAQAKAAQLSLF